MVKHVIEGCLTALVTPFKAGRVDFDALAIPATGVLPVGVPGAVRGGGARNKQQPRTPTRRAPRSSTP